MKKFFVLVKKEIAELMTPQMILPLVVMVVIFGAIGSIMSKETAKINRQQEIIMVDMDNSFTSQSVKQVLEKANFKVIFEKGKIEDAINLAHKQRISLVLVVPNGFEHGLKDFVPQKIDIYNLINSFSLMSTFKNQILNSALTALNDYFSASWLQEKNVNLMLKDFKAPLQASEYVIINKNRAAVSLNQVMNYVQQQTTFIPIILFLVIVIAAQMVAMTVANEKENKTFETLLSSPVSRKTIVFAKLLGAGLVALLFSLVYMVGYYYYVGGLMGNQLSIGSEAAQPAFQQLGIILNTIDYILLGTSLFLGILVALAISLLLGILADSVKSVQAVTTPLMVLVLLPYLLVMFLDINSLAPTIKYLIYAIPFAHPFLAAQKVMLHDYLFIIYGIIYQIIIFIIFVFIAAKVFTSDKVLTIKLGRKK